MSYLLALIDDYKDRHGNPSDSSIARAIGAAPQTLNSWRHRGIKALPNPELLRNLAAVLHEDYETVVLRAAMVDAGWMDPPGEGKGAGATSSEVG